jgi:hypothetical protein
MNTDKSNHSFEPRPTTPALMGTVGHSQDMLKARREATQRSVGRRDLFLGSTILSVLAIAGGASFIAGGGRPLAHDIDHGAQAALRNRVENVSDAFSHPSGPIPGEPSLSDAAHTTQVNEAENRAVAANAAHQQHEQDPTASN